jgi:hypothetical protein
MEANMIGEFLRKVEEGNENVLEIVKEAGADGKTTVALQRRKLRPEPPKPPQRLESPRRAHVFHEVDGFIHYLERYMTDENTTVLANVAGRTMHAVIDEAAAEGLEVIEFTPKIHPLFAPWEPVLSGRPIPVMGFALFIMQHRRQVTEPDGRELALIFSQVRSASSLTVEKGKGARSINGMMVETTIQGQKDRQYVDLPEKITINVPLFVGEQDELIEVDLLVYQGQNGPADIVVSCTASALEEALINSFLAMLDKIGKALKEVCVSLGEAKHRSWDYLAGIGDDE